MHASSSLAAEKNGNVLVLRPSVPWTIRPADVSSAGPVGCGLADLFAVRALAGLLPSVSWRVRRAHGLAGEEPQVHGAVRPARWSALPRDDQPGRCRIGTTAPQHGEG